ncbi:MAG: hypothetical protein IAE82_14605 [Opitutaceae bacterium]|nr:hypothetical protein [Opitutaceae bacterium]
MAVADVEYLRLLGYPAEHVPGDRARELMQWARAWYGAHGEPWTHCREVPLSFAGQTLILGGREFRSGQLCDHLRASGARCAVLAAVSAGAACEEEACRLWEAGRPDEYFFLETYASAVVEQLLATVSGRVCAEAASRDLMAVPHYSPGYTGWDVADQARLVSLVVEDGARALPGPLAVLPSGMLRPKKSQLAVIGLAPRTEAALRAARVLPCERCSWSPCQFRRSAYRHAPVHIDGAPAPARMRFRAPGYTVNERALRKWAMERVRLEPRADGTTVATFRFDGTTCSNLGHPLAFDYRIVLGPAGQGRVLLEARCAPAPGDGGHAKMCSFLGDAHALMGAITSERPLLGRPLDTVLSWERAPVHTGCLCEAGSRAHKWGLALEAVHYALAHPAAGAIQPARAHRHS